jgi:hypothetical protein
MKRLDELPKDLHLYYKHMWQKVEPRYHEEASKLLQLVMMGETRAFISARNKCSFQALFEKPYHSHQTKALTLLFAVKSLNDAIKAPIKPLNDIAQKLKDFEGRLNHVCFGLLELCHGDLTSDWDVSKWNVRFLHRSAKDFLNQPEVWNEILSKTRCSTFDINVSLVSSYLQELKAWRMPPDKRDSISIGYGFISLWEIVYVVMDFAYLSEISTKKSQERLLDEGRQGGATSCRYCICKQNQEAC